jgi:hypothetical protein
MNYKIYILMLALATANIASQVNSIQDKCLLIDNAKELTSNPCFDKVQNIIACMKACEQQIWVDAFKKNTDSSKCFNCSFDKALVKSCNISYANDLVTKFRNYNSDERKSVKCLYDFEVNNELLNTSDFSNYVQNTYATTECYRNFIVDVVNVNIKRRRYLCMSNADRDNATLNVDNNGRITQFKFSPYETNVLVGSFNNYADCKARLGTSISNTVQAVIQNALQSPKCAPDSSSNGTSTKTNTSTQANISTQTTTSSQTGTNANTPKDTTYQIPSTTLGPETTTAQISTPKINSSLDNEAIQMFKNLLADVSSNTALVNDLNTAITSIKTYGVIIDPSYSHYVLTDIQLTDDYEKKAIQTLLAFEKATNTCDANTNYIISLSNKTLKCEGTSCPADFA